VSVTFAGLKFPIKWGVDYYTPVTTSRETRIHCSACDGAGEVTLRDGRIYECPNCGGKGVSREYDYTYSVGVYRLDCVYTYEDRAELMFRNKNQGRYICVKSNRFATMRLTVDGADDDKTGYLYDTREAAQAEANRLNEERGAK